ncbi:MAG: ATP-binding cassette domain-containing protein [Candidatus Auribacterota bacterium]|jgi:ABC-2 type transport system ATP-binding protein|nr:ATP-binding cassette domain-containing protein [Candidatus Auribacterota bacterium]
MIEVKNLTKHYGITVAVKDVSFSVKKGEVLGFLGPNGAGKTTTMKIITCFMPPTAGTVEVGGSDILEDPLSVREKIGYLPENTPLYSDMTVESYLNFIAEVRRIHPRDRRERVNRMIETCSLKGVLKKDIGALSKGFKQRVGLAQAMIHDPKILILDEPTSGLDPNQIIEIRKLIKELGKEKTIILSTHILPEVSATCDRVIIINDGQLVASGTPEELQNRAAGESVIYTTVKADAAKVQTVFTSLGWVKKCSVESKQGERARFKLLATQDVSDPTEQLYDIAVKNGWMLSELYRETLSLEDIFLKLTTS